MKPTGANIYISDTAKVLLHHFGLSFRIGNRIWWKLKRH